MEDKYTVLLKNLAKKSNKTAIPQQEIKSIAAMTKEVKNGNVQ